MTDSPSFVPATCLLLLAAAITVRPAHATAAELQKAAADAKQGLRERHGDTEADRIDRGVDQVVRLWRDEDGDAAAFKEFVTSEFLPTGEALDGAFRRFESASESVNGYFTAMIRDLRRGVDLDLGPVTSLDRRLAAWNAASHVSDDMFGNKLAFVALLNFPLSTLDERMAKGMDWSRRQWAETRLAGQFQTRVPADVQAKITTAYSAADAYINDYNV
jgi:hypothetical protein